MRRFEVRELCAREIAQLAFIGAGAFVENDKSVRRFAPFLMRESDDRYLLHGRVSQKHDYFRGSVVADQPFECVRPVRVDGC